MRRRRVLLFVTPLIVGTIAACGSVLVLEEPLLLDGRGDATTSDVITPPSGDGAVDTADATLDAEPTADASVPVSDATVMDALAPIEGGGTCNVRVDAPALADGTHVAEGTTIPYASNPPSSGAHYGSWANFQEFDHPVADGYLVHALEHGAVLLLYKCPTDAGACNALLTQLRAVRDAVPTDPMCSDAIRVRVILAPRAANDTTVAAAAWGHTYRSDCVEATSLGQFITAHYAKAPEDFCFQGSVF